jgi:hypothetical protein
LLEGRLADAAFTRQSRVARASVRRSMMRTGSQLLPVIDVGRLPLLSRIAYVSA